MGQLSKERLRAFDDNCWKYYDWLAVLEDAGIKEIQDLQGQYLLKCPFHEDWSPSFRIRVHEHNYHCFSCGAFGSVANLMWKLSESSLGQAQFYEQLLKSNPPLQKELGFSSLYLDIKSMDPASLTRHRFNPKEAIGLQLPVSSLSKQVRMLRDDWTGLVFTLSLLQQGDTTDNVLARAKQVFSEQKRNEEKASEIGKVSLLTLIGDESFDDSDA